MVGRDPSGLRRMTAAALFVALGSLGPPVAARLPIATIAMFPVQNLTGGPIPGAEIRQSLIDRFAAAGLRIVGDEPLETFMTRHRVRYVAGIDGVTASNLRQDTGADAVAIASIELSSEAVPPKVAVFVRIVSIVDAPVVLWADDASMAGDDAPGLFERGIVNEYQTLLARSLDRLGESLEAYLRTGRPRTDVKRASKFKPKSYDRRLFLEPNRSYSVAVVPFYNLSRRQQAGEILALHFIRHLTSFPQFDVIDSGVVRQQLLDARIIMDAGLSIGDASIVGALAQADFVLAGRVLRYEDYDGPAGQTGVEFSTVLIERESQRVVWSSDSYNDGRDGVGFFERGSSKTAHVMATQMVRLATELLAGRGH